MYYEMPKNIEERLKEGGLDLFESSVLKSVLKLEEKGYKVTFAKGECDAEGVIEKYKTRTDIYINDSSISYSFDIYELNRILNAILRVIMLVPAVSKETIGEVA